MRFGGPGRLRQCCVDRKCVKIVSRLQIVVPTKGSYRNTSVFSDIYIMHNVKDHRRDATTDIPFPKRWKSEIINLEPPSDCKYIATKLAVILTSSSS